MKNYLYRKGSSVIATVFFCFCVFIMLGAVFFRQNPDETHNSVNLLDRQAYFAARSAMQHFLLKAKFFPNELCDAIDISKGRNPVFDFKEYSSLDRFGKEIFKNFEGTNNIYIRQDVELNEEDFPTIFFTKLPNKDKYIKLASYNNSFYRFIAPNIYNNNPLLKYIEPNKIQEDYYSNKYLTYFYRDCTNYLVNDEKLQPLLEIISDNRNSNNNEFDITKSRGNPYNLRYKVIEVKTKLNDDNTEKEINIIVEGKVINTQNKEHSQIHTRNQIIRRNKR